MKTGDWFTEYPFQGADYFLFDLGVVDANDDGFLDVFTSNHNALQSLLLSNGSGKFNDVLFQRGLAQDRKFPGLESMDNAELLLDSPGLYIYWRNKNLIIQAHRSTASVDQLSGQIVLSSPIKIVESSRFDTEVETYLLPSEATRTTVKFAAEEGGRLVFRPKFIAIPISFKLDVHSPLSNVFIGAERIQPSSHNFALFLRDRHGMAWADYNGDGKLDLFITRGGLKGKMAYFPDTYSDELFVNEGFRFRDDTTNSGIVKNACSGRQAAWVDFNNDNKLDLYISSGWGHPNQLYQQKNDGLFVNVGHQLGLDNTEGKSVSWSWFSSFAWLDADLDGDMDLLLGEKHMLFLYLNHRGSFSPKSIATDIRGVVKLALSDYDSDGDMDIFVASIVKTALLINKNGDFEQIDPTKIGLPIASMTANWVDYDNDGLPDLHIVPGGLYRQRPDHTFEVTNLLVHNTPSLVGKARCAWFDLDNDGARDLVVMH